ncbi:MAG: RNA methyltransferase [Lachnospiraceae bacterium]|nr:RNA methyltransferase [Lachnospiraceae bacterium]
MLTNNNIKKIKNLIARSKARREAGLFVIEGRKMFMEAPDDWIREIYVTKDFLLKNEASHKLSGHEYTIVTDDQMERLCDTKTPQGVLCVLQMPEHELPDFCKDEENAGSTVMILEDIQDPGNLGTIIRTAEAAGVAHVIMSSNTVDIYNPKTIRSTMGSIYRVPFSYTDDLKASVAMLKEKGYKVYAAHLKGERFYNEVDYGRTAFMIGNEGNGLKDETAALADEYIKIPMKGEVESLNAAIAAAILMFAAFR